MKSLLFSNILRPKGSQLISTLYIKRLIPLSNLRDFSTRIVPTGLISPTSAPPIPAFASRLDVGHRPLTTRIHLTPCCPQVRTSISHPGLSNPFHHAQNVPNFRSFSRRSHEDLRPDYRSTYHRIGPQRPAPIPVIRSAPTDDPNQRKVTTKHQISIFRKLRVLLLPSILVYIGYRIFSENSSNLPLFFDTAREWWRYQLLSKFQRKSIDPVTIERENQLIDKLPVKLTKGIFTISDCIQIHDCLAKEYRISRTWKSTLTERFFKLKDLQDDLKHSRRRACTHPILKTDKKFKEVADNSLALHKQLESLERMLPAIDRVNELSQKTMTLCENIRSSSDDFSQLSDDDRKTLVLQVVESYKVLHQSNVIIKQLLDSSYYFDQRIGYLASTSSMLLEAAEKEDEKSNKIIRKRTGSREE